MNKKVIILVFSTLFFVTTTGYFGIQYVRFKERSMYHRSRMFEYELIANLYKIFPVGTSLEVFLSKLELDKSIVKNYSPSDSVVIDILPELPIPKDDQRDYSGFYVKFTDGKLSSIVPVGPDGARNIVRLSELDIGKEIVYFQDP